MNHRTRPQQGPFRPCIAVDPYTGRVWPPQLIDRFIVGLLHGSYIFPQTCVHLYTADESFVNVTEEELRRFWDILTMTSTIYFFWKHKSSEDAEVKKVLQDIDTLMDDALMDVTLSDESLKYYNEHPDELENI